MGPASGVISVKRIAKRLAEFRPHDRVHRADGDALHAAIRILREPALARSIMARLSDARIAWGKPGDRDAVLPDGASDHAYTLCRVVDAAIEWAGVQRTEGIIRLQGDDACLAAVVAALRQHASEANLGSFRIEPSGVAAWEQLLRPQAAYLPWPQWRTDALMMSEACGLRTEWGRTVIALEEVLTQHDMTAQSASSLIELVEETFRRDAQAGKKLAAAVVPPGRAAQAVTLLMAAGQPDVAMRWMALVMLQGDPLAVIGPDPHGPAATKTIELLRARSPEANSLVRQLAHAIASLGVTEPFTHLFGNRVTFPHLIRGLVREWISEDALPRCMSTALVVNQWPEYREFFAVSPEQDVNWKAILHALWMDATLQRTLSAKALSRRAAFLVDAMESGFTDLAVSAESLQARLNGLTEADWKTALSELSTTTRVLIEAAKPPRNVRMGNTLKEALRDCADRLGGTEAVWAPEQWPLVAQVVRCLAVDQLQVLGSDVLDQVGRGQLSHGEARIACFRDAMDASLASCSPGPFVRGAARMVVKGTNAAWLAWLEDVIERHPRIWSEATAAERSDLRSLVGTQAQVIVVPEDVRGRLQALAARLAGSKENSSV